MNEWKKEWVTGTNEKRRGRKERKNEGMNEWWFACFWMLGKKKKKKSRKQQVTGSANLGHIGWEVTSSLACYVQYYYSDGRLTSHFLFVLSKWHLLFFRRLFLLFFSLFLIILLLYSSLILFFPSVHTDTPCLFFVFFLFLFLKLLLFSSFIPSFFLLVESIARLLPCLLVFYRYLFANSTLPSIHTVHLM